MWSRLTVPLLTLLLGLVACTPLYVVHPARTPALNLQGPPPDVVIFSMSGRCGPPCLAPRDNWDYLGSRGTLDRLADVFTAAGYRVQVSGYASNAAATFSSEYIGGPQRGYEALRSDFARVAQTWMKAARPPRLVLLGHSQGSVWLHHLARVNPYVPVALQVDLDGICVAWKSDFGEGIRELGDVYGDEPSPCRLATPLRWPGARWGPRTSCGPTWPSIWRSRASACRPVPARAAAGRSTTCSRSRPTSGWTAPAPALSASSPRARTTAPSRFPTATRWPGWRSRRRPSRSSGRLRTPA
ncbi:hypothetical protein ACFP9V_17745 [Deinococcus radiopugnans]|uniref:hypothetical protein n=1 Tax=Deinococcus radiopugnans TaxID=57497 RepID=UPI003611A7FA